jgi:hypothetical protein
VLLPSPSILNHLNIQTHSILCTLVPSNNKIPSYQKFAKAKQILEESSAFNITQIEGGWQTVESLAPHPKQTLVDYVMDYNSGDIVANPSQVFALVGLLQAQGKGFTSDLVDGEWISVLSQEGTKSPRLQKLVSKGDRKRRAPAYANFDINTQEFYGDVPILKYGSLQSTVSVCRINESFVQSECNIAESGLSRFFTLTQYNPVKDAHDVFDGKIVLRRISCDIVGASWKWWKLPRIPLPLRAKGGFLDFVYLDKDLRITKGNRGGIFIHFRPEFLESQQKERLKGHENENGEGI